MVQIDFSRACRWIFILLFSSGAGAALVPAASDAQLLAALTFRASFDRGLEADAGKGERRLYTAPSYREADSAQVGIHSPTIRLMDSGGRLGGALEFSRKNTAALFYKADRNISFSSQGWSGTVSFWLSLDPETDLEPGFCDPIQITDKAYNDAAIWVDFTKDNPRIFRLGIFGDLAAWNPENKPPDKNPDFEKRLVAVADPPFDKGKWTHVAITYSGLGTPQGKAVLYMDGRARGTSPAISEAFTWDMAKATIRLGVNYVGLFDELSLFSRPLTAQEIRRLYEQPELLQAAR